MKAIKLKRKDGVKLPVNSNPFDVYFNEFGEHVGAGIIIKTGLIVEISNEIEFSAEWAGTNCLYPIGVEIIDSEICIIFSESSLHIKVKEKEIPLARVRVFEKRKDVGFRFIEVDENTGGRKMFGNSKNVNVEKGQKE